jgi:hypothetical protein
MVRSQEPKEAQTRCWKQSLADDSRLDEDVVGVELAPDGVAVLRRRTMEVLVAAAPPPRLHVGHPEVVAERTDQPHRLLERVLDFEAQAVEANDLDGRQGVSMHIRRQQPLVGWITATKRTSRPAGRHSRSRTLYCMTTWRSP